MLTKFQLLPVLAIILLQSSLLPAQSVCPPPSGENCTQWTASTYETNTENPDCLLTVNYRWRICGNIYQIYIDGYTSQGNCSHLNQGGSTFQEWVNLVLIEELTELQGQGSPSNCPDSSLKAIFYTASCGLWVKCEYTIDSTSRVCDVDWRGSYPDYDSGGVKKVIFWKWQTCGQTCCKKTYNICKQFNATNNSYDLIINSVKKEQIGACTNPDRFTQPCTNGC